MYDCDNCKLLAACRVQDTLIVLCLIYHHGTLYSLFDQLWSMTSACGPDIQLTICQDEQSS
jgi:hypothetical protein